MQREIMTSIPFLSQPSAEALNTPEDLAAALANNKAANATFDAFPPGCRREYIEWIAEAKRARDAQSSPIPLPPAREQRRYYPEAYHANRAKRAASRAIDAEFNPTDVPF